MIRISPTSQSFDKSIDKDALTLADMWFKSHDNILKMKHRYFTNPL